MNAADGLPITLQGISRLYLSLTLLNLQNIYGSGKATDPGGIQQPGVIKV